MPNRAALVCLLLFLCSTAVPGSADQAEPLLQPRFVELYDKNQSELTDRERWRVMIHGLRMAPLDPRVWGIRVTERTENRRLVPMRPFILRASAGPRFFLQELKLKFKFVRATPKDMERNFHSKDPLLDIFFGGEYSARPGKVERDRGYLVRLTAFPGYKSGIYYHSHGALEPVLLLDDPLLETARDYEVVLRGDRDQVVLALDGTDKLALKGQELHRGMVGLMTGWNPVKLSELLVQGYLLHEDGRREEVKSSGLIALSEKAGK